MEKCPFLSTVDEDIQCFKECAFYNCSDFNNECPFKQLINEIDSKFDKKKCDYDMLIKDKNSPVSLLYK